MMRDMIHVAYAVHDEHGSFSKFTGTSIASIFMNTSSRVVIHILHDESLSKENREKFEALAEKYGQEIRFYDVEELATRDLIKVLEAMPEMSESRFSVGAFYRLLVGKVIPHDVKKLIYLDSDIIVNLDIAELYAEPVGANGIAAVMEHALTHGKPAPQPLVESGEVPRDKYFNSGVMVMDMDKFRSHESIVDDGLLMLKNHPDSFCYDQDVLNYFFHEGYRELDIRYDRFVSIERHHGFPVSAGIYHFAGHALDFFLKNDSYNRLFINAFVQTPWFSAEMLEQIFGGIFNAYGVWRDSGRKAINAFSGKSRVFCGEANKERLIRKLFEARDDEEYRAVAVAGGKIFVQKLLDEMKNSKSKRKKVIYVLCLAGGLAGINGLRRFMDEAGLVENEDYIDGGRFIPESDGGWQLSSFDFFSKI